ncbi:MAG: energy-coupling factor ABC transporter ATP-binding protein [Candidatus Asgardarchaeia archaeon]
MALIEIKDLWFRYGKESPWILKEINVEVEEGEFLSIIGQNGCGKTTLVKHLNGLLKPTKGDVLIKGMNTRNVETYELAKVVGHVFQYPDSQIFADTIFNEVSFGPINLNFTPEEIERAVHTSLKKVNLHKPLDVRPDSLSTGEKERLAIADILATNPDILILDEPTTGQDYHTCESIMKIARELVDSGKTVILISHDMELVAEWSDRTLVMSDGRIVKDAPPQEVFTDFKLLETVEINPLQVSQVAKLLGMNETPITILDFIDSLERWLLE